MSLQSDIPDDTGPLTIDEALERRAALSSVADEIDDDEPANPDPAPLTPAEPAADGAELVEDEPVEGEEPTGGEEDDEGKEPEAEKPAEPVVAPPNFWNDEEKAVFATAPPEVQKLVADKVAESSKQATLATEQAALYRKEADIIGQAVELIDGQLTAAKEVFGTRWSAFTPEQWAEWAAEDLQAATVAKFQFDAEQKQLDELSQAREAAEAEQHRQFLREQAGKLAEVAPALIEASARTELIGYLTEQGLTPQDLKWAGAVELSLAHKAMLWDRAQANLAKKPIPQPTQRSATPVRPAGAQQRGSSQSRQVQALESRFAKTGSMDDALALRRARRGQG
jgi:hypothetical protein